MTPSYPYLPFFWAAYAITAVIYIAYGMTLYRRYLRTRRQHVLLSSVHERSGPQ